MVACTSRRHEDVHCEVKIISFVAGAYLLSTHDWLDFVMEFIIKFTM